MRIFTFKKKKKRFLYLSIIFFGFSHIAEAINNKDNYLIEHQDNQISQKGRGKKGIKKTQSKIFWK